jgi:hypothetical protein
MQRFIVAEISKNWESHTPVNELMGQQFEAVINTNADRGYRLIDWKISSANYGNVYTETIIAIFEHES